MFYRKELKTNAKKLLSRNYWWIILVTIIFGLITGRGIGLNFDIVEIFRLNSQMKLFNQMTFTGSEFRDFDSMFNAFDNEFGDNAIDAEEFSGLYDIDGDDFFIWDDGVDDFYTEDYYSDEYFREYFQEVFGTIFSSPFIYAFLLTLLIAFLMALALSVFLLSPLLIGCRRWYIKNRKQQSRMGDIGYVFTHGYWNVVKIMFCRDIFIILWSLLFIIPGIVKSYEYRMVPYLLAENPQMDRQEAFERSRMLMKGKKWATFVLDLSFIGWAILSTLTFGILGIFYVYPYIQLTNTELYVCLCQGRESYIQDSGISMQQNGYGNI